MELALSCSPDAMRRGIERRLTSIARVPSSSHDGRLKTYHTIVPHWPICQREVWSTSQLTADKVRRHYLPAMLSRLPDVSPPAIADLEMRYRPRLSAPRKRNARPPLWLDDPGPGAQA